MPKPPATAALGFRPHTYWTAAVALGGPRDEPHLIERRRIDFASGDTRSVYHHAEQLPRGEAEAWIARTWTAVEANARRGIAGLLEDLGREGVTFAAAIVPIGRKQAPDRLEDVLKSHTHIHAAEGDFYRAVVAEACVALGLEVRRVTERELPDLVAALIGPPSLEARLKAMGKALGPPWSQDQQLATLAAWTALPEIAP
jgi:hypothetical protein